MSISRFDTSVAYHVQFFESRAADLRVEVDSFEERIDLDGSRGRRRQRALGTFARASQSTNSFRVSGDILVVLATEFLDEVLHQSIIEIFATEMSVTG